MIIVFNLLSFKIEIINEVINKLTEYKKHNACYVTYVQDNDNKLECLESVGDGKDLSNSGVVHIRVIGQLRISIDDILNMPHVERFNVFHHFVDIKK